MVQQFQQECNMACGFAISWTNSGNTCEMEFKSRDGLMFHQTIADEHGHNRVFVLSGVAVVPRCPCLLIFHGPCNKYKKTFETQFHKRCVCVCAIDCASVPLKDQCCKDDFLCPNCGFPLTNICEYNTHCKDVHGSLQTGLIDCRLGFESRWNHRIVPKVSAARSSS